MSHLKSSLGEAMNQKSDNVRKFLLLLELFLKKEGSYADIADALDMMIRICYECDGMQPLVLIDEYDQPLLASHVNGYHREVKEFLSAFYTKALKDNPYIYRAVMTGIQRMAKESIFSKFNNPSVYTVMDKTYSTCFGFTEEETEALLATAGLKLDEETREMYDGYCFSGTSIYNPSSIIGYAQKQELRSYWLNTSSNRLIHSAIASAKKDDVFCLKYEQILEKGEARVSAVLDTSYMELSKSATLWGLLINAGYLTVSESGQGSRVIVRIPNKEVRGEFITMISEELELESGILEALFLAAVTDLKGSDVMK